MFDKIIEAARQRHLARLLAEETAHEEQTYTQAERMYSEEEVIKLLIYCKDRFGGSELYDYTHDDEVKNWFEQVKKK
jgi:hypothetical protein